MKLTSCSVLGHLHFPRVCLWSTGGKPVGYFDVNLFSQVTAFLVCNWFSYILLCVIDTGDCWLWTEMPTGWEGGISLVGLSVWRPLCVAPTSLCLVWRLLFRDLWQVGRRVVRRVLMKSSDDPYLPVSFLWPQLAEWQAGSQTHFPTRYPSATACLHYLLSKETSFSRWYVLCKSQLCGNSTWQTLTDLLNITPYSFR